MMVERGKYIIFNLVIFVLLLCFLGLFDSVMAMRCNDEPKSHKSVKFLLGHSNY